MVGGGVTSSGHMLAAVFFIWSVLICLHMNSQSGRVIVRGATQVVTSELLSCECENHRVTHQITSGLL